MFWDSMILERTGGFFCEEYGPHGHEDADFVGRALLSGLSLAFIKEKGIHLDDNPLVHDNNQTPTPYDYWKVEKAAQSKDLFLQNLKKYKITGNLIIL